MIKPNFSVSIMRAEQLADVMKYDIEKIYIPFDLLFWGLISIDDIDTIHSGKKLVYISMPRIIRKKDELYLDSLKETLLLGKVDGVLLKNIDSVGFIFSLEDELEKQYISINGKIDGYTTLIVETDFELYNWNKASLDFNKKYSCNQTVPMELSIHEIKEINNMELVFPIYGRAQLMVSANCVKKTTGNCMADCSHGSFEWRLNDRKNKQFLVYSNCIHCYNEIYNSVVTSLHRQFVDIQKAGFNNFRIDFTNENSEMINKILTYYLLDNRKGSFPISEYTTAHINKGAI